MHGKDTAPGLPPDEQLSLKEKMIRSDVLGSYTGRVCDPYEIPVQDADDL